MAPLCVRLRSLLKGISWDWSAVVLFCVCLWTTGYRYSHFILCLFDRTRPRPYFFYVIIGLVVAFRHYFWSCSHPCSSLVNITPFTVGQIDILYIKPFTSSCFASQYSDSLLTQFKKHRLFWLFRALISGSSNMDPSSGYYTLLDVPRKYESLSPVSWDVDSWMKLRALCLPWT